MGVLLYAIFVTFSANPSGRKVGPSSLYPYLHPAKIIFLRNFMQIRDATTRAKIGIDQLKDRTHSSSHSWEKKLKSKIKSKFDVKTTSWKHKSNFQRRGRVPKSE